METLGALNYGGLLAEMAGGRVIADVDADANSPIRPGDIFLIVRRGTALTPNIS